MHVELGDKRAARHSFDRKLLTQSLIWLFSGMGAFGLGLAGCGGTGSQDSGATPGSADSSSSVSSSSSSSGVSAPTLVGYTNIPRDTYVAGPSSGQFISGGDLTTAISTYGYTLPFSSKQPIEGISALAKGPVDGTYYIMQDNGFGSKASSPDALLHVYAIKPDWSGSSVTPVDFSTGAALSSFTSASFIRLSDPNKKLGFSVVADGTNYPGTTTSTATTGQTVAVDPLITANRLLTGADIDPESIVVDSDGSFWFGEEFGPFLIHTDATGKVLEAEIPVPNSLALDSNPYVQTSNNPYLASSSSANLPSSGGFENMAVNPSHTRLYTMFEREMSADTNKQRRIMNVFDIANRKFLSTYYAYKVDTGTYTNASGTAVTEYFTVNDMTAINDHEFLVVEKDRGAGDARTGLFVASNAARVAAKIKRIYKVDLNKVDADGFLVKTLLVDLMNIADPQKLGGTYTIDGVFTFPMESIESVRIVDKNTIMVANDNNYPGGSSSRNPSLPDNNEFILIRLPAALDLVQ
jgi:hypothetical protein